MLRSPNHIVLSIFSRRFYHKASKGLRENLKPGHRVQENEPISDKIRSSYLGQPSPFTHPHKLSPEQVTEGLSKEEFAERRLKLMFNVKKCAEDMGARPSNRNLIIMPASTTVFSGPDVPYPFRQESNFLYLTGYHEPDSILVVHDDTSNGVAKTILFVAPKDPQKELWEGSRAGVEGAKALTGVDTTGFIDDFQTFFENFAGKFNKNNLHIYYDDSSLGGVNIKPSYKNFLSNHEDFTILSPLNFVHELRWRKSPAEIQLLRRSCDIAARGFVETMRFCHADIDENHLLGKFDFECKINGARGLAYPPVVAGGNRANTIHYLNADQLVRENELVLMDAGCDFGGYSSDITRCWPVSGKFNSAQKELYEMLLKVQVDLIQYLENTRPASLRDFYIKMIDLLTIGLSELGLFTKDSLEARRCLADSFCPHHVSHYLGLDVHDTETVSKTRPLESGVVVTVEPGLYFKDNDERIPEKFRGIGLRIEDDILITESGLEVLSARTPKDIATIEEIMKHK